MHNQNRRKWLLPAFATAVWMAVIFFFSSQNGDESSGTSAMVLALLCRILRYSPDEGTRTLLLHLIRKTAHMTEFGVLALLWLATLRTRSLRRLPPYPAAFAASSLYAVTDEFHQLFVSDRAGTFTDWIIDSSGALLFLSAAWVISRRRGRNGGDRV